VVYGVYTLDMSEKPEDPSVKKAKALFEKSNMTMNELGLKMGFPPETARQAVFQFLKVSDPHISSLRRFAKAMDIPLADLLDEKKSRSK
jgi:transcriptional regulator with XRE-family HTH domain